MSRTRTTMLAMLVSVFAIFSSFSAQAADKGQPGNCFRVGISVYAGWMPWFYANAHNIIDKWAAANGVCVEVVEYPAYDPSLAAISTKDVDAVVMTNMDAFNVPAVSGVDVTSFINGDYSNGGDACIARGINSIAELKGKLIRLTEGTVSHLLLSELLKTAGLSLRDVRIEHALENGIAAGFPTNADGTWDAVCTWNPIVQDLMNNTPGAVNIGNSSMFPGMIVASMYALTEVLNDYPVLGDVMTGSWYEVMALMSRRGKASEPMLEEMALLAGTDLAGYKGQLEVTAMYFTPAEALAYTQSPEFKAEMDRVRNVSFESGIMAQGRARSVDEVGVQFHDSSILGDEDNVMLRFTDVFMKRAAEGKITLK